MRNWKEHEDPLFRGDSVDVLQAPDPRSDPSWTRHILQIEGPGQSSPYLSTSESEETARFFAVPKGYLHETDVPRVRQAELGHLGKNDLMQALVGTGKGKAKWHSAREVARAAELVEKHGEHLVDFRPCADDDEPERQARVQKAFSLRKKL